ncbi:MAG TPA: aminotransferase class V-fold PLP-dependent enzyme [Gemmatimonadales bacterium]|nr:aminotransferase class V-fold PLP-dependent enzyme [Gemmatimonadales bacterium]
MTPAQWDPRVLREAEFSELGETIYLNSASTGPLPERSRRALEIFNQRRGAPHLLPDEEVFAMLDQTRALIARLLNASADEIALTLNTSFGLNLAAMGLPFDAGDVVVFSDREFPANAYPWLALAERGVVVERVPVLASGWPDEDRLVERMHDPRVRVVAVSLVQFSNGYAVDLARLSAESRATDTWLVVDGIQGVGQLPVDLKQTPVDVMAVGGQKWLLGPWGTGFAYVRRELLASLRPPLIDWMAFDGTDDFTRLTDYQATLRNNARRYEMITLPYQDFDAFNRSLELVLEHGVPAIARHVRALQEPLIAWARRHDVRIVSPLDQHRSSIVCIAPEDARASYEALRDAGVIASFREGAIRLAPHLFNSMDEMERVVEVMDGRKSQVARREPRGP